MKLSAPRSNEVDNEISYLLIMVLHSGFFFFFLLCFCFYNSSDVNKTQYHHLWMYSKKKKEEEHAIFRGHCYIKTVTIPLKQGAHLFSWCPETCAINICIYIFSSKTRNSALESPYSSGLFQLSFVRTSLWNILIMQFVPEVGPEIVYF